MERRTPGPGATQRGFTLLEIAVVLLVTGLLLGVVFKGQELITAARTRNITQQLDHVRTAYFAFVDRYRAIPGDFRDAASTISGVSNACGYGGNGNGDGRIELGNGESILAWEHLARSGMLTGSFRCSGNTNVSSDSVPTNYYNQFLQIVFDNNFTGENATSRHNLKTGSGMPSYLLAEVDRKVDDGNAATGIFRGSTYSTGAAVDAGCWDTTSGAWATPGQNCSAAHLF